MNFGVCGQKGCTSSPPPQKKKRKRRSAPPPLSEQVPDTHAKEVELK